jgi:C-methyltransferase-like protein/putative zinc binding protein/methyltransferase family protein
LTCRSCGRAALVEVLDLGEQPEANSFPPAATDAAADPRWPLGVRVCTSCWLVQLAEGGPPETALPGPPAHDLSSTMRAHAERFVADVLARIPWEAAPRVVEMASHGGHLAPFFRTHGVQSVVVEGTPALAAAAAARGLRVVDRPFGRVAAEAIVADGGPADLVVDNYLLAHIEDPNDVAAGLRLLIRPDGGRAVLEFDHLLPLARDRRFDSIRHGHYSYLGLLAVTDLLGRHGLDVVDAVMQPVYGGALRIVVAHAGEATPAGGVGAILDAERAAGLDRVEAYEQFAAGVGDLRAELRAFLDARRDRGESVAGYGAPSRGNTLLNTVGVTSELLPFTVDRSPLKQGARLPGSGIPIHEPARLLEARPAYVLILSWDVRDEVISSLPEVEGWGGRFVVPLPTFEVLGG